MLSLLGSSEIHWDPRFQGNVLLDPQVHLDDEMHWDWLKGGEWMQPTGLAANNWLKFGGIDDVIDSDVTDSGVMPS